MTLDELLRQLRAYRMRPPHIMVYVVGSSSLANRHPASRCLVCMLQSLPRWKTTWSTGSGGRCCCESRALWCCTGVTDACLAREFYLCIQTKTKWKKG